MNEREVIRNLIDFSFMIKAQLQSEDTALLRSILSLVIMECEDVLHPEDAAEDCGSSDEDEDEENNDVIQENFQANQKG